MTLTSTVAVSKAAAPSLELVRPFSALGLADLESAGGKGANLGELTRAGFSVPEGFVITAEAYLTTLDIAGSRQRALALFRGIDVDNAEALREGAKSLRAMVQEAGMPAALREQILARYRSLGNDVRVAVRSSATSEDTGGSSFAGMHETYTHVQGEVELLDKVRACWTSVWGERVISYRTSIGLMTEPAIAVVVQRMVNADSAGVMFTADPTTSDRARAFLRYYVGIGLHLAAHHHFAEAKCRLDHGARACSRPAWATRPTSSCAARRAPSVLSSAKRTQ
jgi:pyruvate,water dikinase